MHIFPMLLFHAAQFPKPGKKDPGPRIGSFGTPLNEIGRQGKTTNENGLASCMDFG